MSRTYKKVFQKLSVKNVSIEPHKIWLNKIKFKQNSVRFAWNYTLTLLFFINSSVFNLILQMFESIDTFKK